MGELRQPTAASGAGGRERSLGRLLNIGVPYLWLLLFFLALAVPTAVLVRQAYSQLKWEAFHQHQDWRSS